MASPVESPSPNSGTLEGSTHQAANIPFVVRAFASGLFSGYSPVATGTVGSALALAIYFVPGFEHPYVIMPACFLILLLGAKSAGIMEQVYGHDPAEVTIDEVLGMWLSLFLLPKSFLIGIVGFFLFRILDVIKPFPAKRVDAMTGGFGIMLDDVICGFYTNLLLHLLVALHIIQ